MYHVPGVRHFLISIHALRGEGDILTCGATLAVQISIHALRGEGDDKSWFDSNRPHKFLSTPSAGRATRRHAVPSLALGISIHALRGEGDGMDAVRPSAMEHFYPRPPRGGRRPHHGPPLQTAFYFYPRPPRGGRPPASARTAGS